MKRNLKSNLPTEITAVLINLESGEIESEFQEYVHPTEKTVLSDLCIHSTGVSQEDVDQANTLPKALKSFEFWLLEELTSRQLYLPKMFNQQVNCALATWSNVELDYSLTCECKRKHYDRAPFLKQWIDLREIFVKTFKYPALDMNTALCHLGLPFEGDLKSSMSKCRNLAKLAFKMSQRGSKIVITRDMVPHHRYSLMIN